MKSARRFRTWFAGKREGRTETPQVDVCCTCALAAVLVCVLVAGGCASSQDDGQYADVKIQQRLQPADAWAGWRADATLAGRGGDGGALADWEWARPSRPNETLSTDPGDRTNGVFAEGGPRIVRISSPQDQTYNLFWTDRARFDDVELLVRFQARSGKVDQGGGLIWRARDRDHYYICRANPLESNFRLYKVIGGVRTQLASVKVEMPVAEHGAPGHWHTIHVRHVGDDIVCTLDAETSVHVRDSSITEPGGIGLWTKADAVVWFDGLRADRAAARD